MPSSVQILGESCFSWCSSLRIFEFEFPSSLRQIRGSVFSGCDKLKNICLPVSVEMIDGSAFTNMKDFTLTIEEGNSHFRVSDDFLLSADDTSAITYLGTSPNVTFYREIKTHSTSCFVPSSVQISMLEFEKGSVVSWIETKVFFTCVSLGSICIPASVEIIGDACFSDCTSLSDVSFEVESKLRRLGAEMFQHCVRLPSICIPSSIEELGKSCFADCRSISTVLFPSHSRLKEIEARAFSRCSKLASFYLPDTVQTIGESCFDGCKRLSVFLVDTRSQLKAINAAVFSGCSRLRLVCIPHTVTSIDGSAFTNTRIWTVSLLGGDNFCLRGKFLLNFARTSVIRYFGSSCSVAVARHIRTLGNSCFGSQCISSLTFESGSRLRQIEESAFSSCLFLSSIKIPALVEKIGSCCFSHCVSLSRIVFEPGSKLYHIKERAFFSCQALGSIYIPASVRIIGSQCFLSCRSLTTVKFEPGSQLCMFHENAFSGCLHLNPVCLPRLTRMACKDGSLIENPDGLDARIVEWPTPIDSTPSFQ
jgi:hypothetical protein